MADSIGRKNAPLRRRHSIEEGEGESIDYRHLLAASSEEDLVLFQASLITDTDGEAKHRQRDKVSAVGRSDAKIGFGGKKSAASKLFTTLRSRLKSHLFTPSNRSNVTKNNTTSSTSSGAATNPTSQSQETGSQAKGLGDEHDESESEHKVHVTSAGQTLPEHDLILAPAPGSGSQTKQSQRRPNPERWSSLKPLNGTAACANNDFAVQDSVDYCSPVCREHKHCSGSRLCSLHSRVRRDFRVDGPPHECSSSTALFGSDDHDDRARNGSLSPTREGFPWVNTGLSEDTSTADMAQSCAFAATDSDDEEQVGFGKSERDPLVAQDGGLKKVGGVYVKVQKPHKKRLAASMVLIVILCTAIGMGVGLGILYGQSSEEEPSDEGLYYKEAVVAADAARCSEIGRNTLLNGGGAIDAAIAGLLCVGLYNSHSTGIGGGSFIVYYDRESESPTFIDAREVAPSLASQDMYQNASDDASTFGGLAVGVPGEIKGYAEAHAQFGKLPWADLFTPSIELAEGGFIVSNALARAISSNEDRILANPSLSKVFTDGEGNILKEGDTMYRPELAQTFRAIADGGADVFYTGQMAATIAAEIQARGGIVTAQDLADYEVAIRSPLSIEINNMAAYTGPPPCSGAVFSLIINILEGYNLTPENLQSVSDEVLTYHRIIEAFKFGYAKRSALGDESFVNVTELVAMMTSQDYADSLRARINDDRTYNYTYYDPSFQIVTDGGTSHISVVDQFGNAASITSTINTYFGSKVRGETTGIIYNNEMDDFSIPGESNYFGLPPSPANFIAPGKRPLSSMTPVIVVDDEGDVRFVVGASGGTRITTGVSLVTIFNMWLGDSLEDSIERRRVHHQLVPEYPTYEPDFPMDIVEGLIAKLHQPQESTSFSVVQAIRRREDDYLEGYCDSRKGGRPSGF